MEQFIEAFGASINSLMVLIGFYIIGKIICLFLHGEE